MLEENSFPEDLCVWLCWVFLAAQWGFLYLQTAGCSCSVILQGLLLSSVAVVHKASLLRGMWPLPWTRDRTLSSALAGRFLITRQPAKPWRRSLNHWASREVHFSHCIVFYFTYLSILAVLGLGCCAGFSVVAVSKGCPLVATEAPGKSSALCLKSCSFF